MDPMEHAFYEPLMYAALGVISAMTMWGAWRDENGEGRAVFLAMMGGILVANGDPDTLLDPKGMCGVFIVLQAMYEDTRTRNRSKRLHAAELQAARNTNLDHKEEN